VYAGAPTSFTFLQLINLSLSFQKDWARGEDGKGLAGGGGGHPPPVLPIPSADQSLSLSLKEDWGMGEDREGL
jgi:hypothetical protein